MTEAGARREGRRLYGIIGHGRRVEWRRIAASAQVGEAPRFRSHSESLTYSRSKTPVAPAMLPDFSSRKNTKRTSCAGLLFPWSEDVERRRDAQGDGAGTNDVREHTSQMRNAPKRLDDSCSMRKKVVCRVTQVSRSLLLPVRACSPQSPIPKSPTPAARLFFLFQDMK